MGHESDACVGLGQVGVHGGVCSIKVEKRWSREIWVLFSLGKRFVHYQDKVEYALRHPKRDENGGQRKKRQNTGHLTLLASTLAKFVKGHCEPNSQICHLLPAETVCQPYMVAKTYQPIIPT